MSVLKETLGFLWLSSLHKLSRTSVLGAIGAGLALYGDVVSPARNAVPQWTVAALAVAVLAILLLARLARPHRPLIEIAANGRRRLAEREFTVPVTMTREISIFAVLAFLMLALTLFGQRTVAASESGAESSGSLFATLIPALNGLRADMQDVRSELQKVKRETSDDPRKELANLGVAWTGEAFMEAVRIGDLRIIDLFLRGGMSPYAANSQGRPLPIMLALNDGNAPQVLARLLEGELDIDHVYELPGAITPVRTTLLGRAIERGNDRLAIALLDAGASANTPLQTFGAMGLTKDTFALASAIQWQRWLVADALLDHDADIALGDYFAYREVSAALERPRSPDDRQRLEALLPRLRPQGADGERLASQMRRQQIDAELNRVALDSLREMPGSTRKRQLDERYDALQRERAALPATAGANPP